MRKAVAVLALGFIASASAALYLAHELRKARAQLAEFSTTDVSSTVHEAPSITGASASASGSAVAAKVEANASRLEHAAQLREILEDPVKREAASRDNKANFRMSFPLLARHLQLDDDEYLRLANLLADQQLQSMEAGYACFVKPHCDPRTVGPSLEPEHRRAVAELLGEENARKFDDYRDNLQERTAVTYLRGVLPDSHPLGEAQAEKLVEALGEERRSVVREWEQRGARSLGSFTSRGAVLIPDSALSVEQKLLEAEQYQRRMRERAGTLLNAQQLATFARVQEDLLDGMRQGWEYQASQAANP